MRYPVSPSPARAPRFLPLISRHPPLASIWHFLTACNSHSLPHYNPHTSTLSSSGGKLVQGAVRTLLGGGLQRDVFYRCCCTDPGSHAACPHPKRGQRQFQHHFGTAARGQPPAHPSDQRSQWRQLHHGFRRVLSRAAQGLSRHATTLPTA